MRLELSELDLTAGEPRKVRANSALPASRSATSGPTPATNQNDHLVDAAAYNERTDGTRWPGGRGDVMTAADKSNKKGHRRHHRGHRHRDTSQVKQAKVELTKEELDKLILETTNPFRSNINLTWTGNNWPRSSTQDHYSFGRLEQKAVRDAHSNRVSKLDKIQPTASFGQHILPAFTDAEVAEAMPMIRPLATTGTVYEDGKRRNIYGLRERGRLTAQNRQFEWKTTSSGNGHGSIDFKKCREALLTSSVILPGCTIWKDVHDQEMYKSQNCRVFVKKFMTGVYEPQKGEAIQNDSATPLTLCPPTKNYSDNSARWTLQQTHLSSQLERGTPEVLNLDHKHSKAFLVPGSLDKTSKLKYGLRTLNRALV